MPDPEQVCADVRDDIEVQVAYATAQHEFLRSLTLAAGATLRQAVVASGLADEVPGIDLDNAACGIHGKKKPPDTLLRDGDRVEVYRPLIADPKEARRRRAGGKAAKSSLGVSWTSRDGGTAKLPPN